MRLKKLQTFRWDAEDPVTAATLANSNELILLTQSGKVNRCLIEENRAENLFSTKSLFEYQDGGFDTGAPCTIYTLGPIVVIVNDYKLHGLVHYPGKYRSLHLIRKDYHSDISKYPIALFQDKNDIPHLIYGTSWNQLQIMNLDTRQVLTAAKSLIEEGAEHHHIEFYKKHREDNKLPWPHPYDYFFGGLQMSPSQRRFLSAGWGWGSADDYRMHEINHFIESHRIAYRSIGWGEHENRSVCWVNDRLIAMAYNPYHEGEEGTTEDSPYHIRLMKEVEGEWMVDRNLEVGDLNVVKAEMAYDSQLQAILVFSNDIGLHVFSLKGELLFVDPEIQDISYYSDTGTFLQQKDNCFTLWQFDKEAQG